MWRKHSNQFFNDAGDGVFGDEMETWQCKILSEWEARERTAERPLALLKQIRHSAG